MPLSFEIVDGSEPPQRTLVLSRVPATIGTSPACDVALVADAVDATHATISEYDDGRDGLWLLTVTSDRPDLRPPRVDGVSVGRTKKRLLRHGSSISIGSARLTMRASATVVGDPARDANTAELALQLVGDALRRGPTDASPGLRVVEGPDLGKRLSIEDGAEYQIGRSHSCAMTLADPDVSREHARVVRRDGVVTVCDLGSTQGVYVGTTKLVPGREAIWPRGRALRMGRSVLVLEASSDELFEDASNDIAMRVEEGRERGTNGSSFPPGANITGPFPSAEGTHAEGSSTVSFAASPEHAETLRPPGAAPAVRIATGAMSATLRRAAFVGTAVVAVLALIATIWLFTR